MTIYSAKKILKESIPLLTFCIFIEIVGGQLLNSKQEVLISVPVILMLIPVINGVGGNIGTILSSRLTSALHTGLISPNLNDKNLQRDIKNSLIIAGVTYFVLALIIWVLAPRLGISNVPTLLELMIITLGAGVILVLSLVTISITSAFFSFKRGLDPDNIVTPLVTTGGDILGIVCLLLMVVVII